MEREPVKSFVGSTVAEIERELILATLEYCRGNRTHAARMLGISLRTVRNKLRQFAEDDPHPQAGRQQGSTGSNRIRRLNP